MAEVVDINAIRARLQLEMDRRGIKAKPLALAAGLNETAVRDVLQRTSDPRVGTLIKLADALEVPLNEVLGVPGVPLLGRIGAGGHILFEESPDPEVVPLPPLAGMGPMMALEVTGDSMLPKYEDGDIIYVRREHDGVLPEYLGEYCAVHLKDGGTFLKILTAGSEPGRYTLRSLNAGEMSNVEVAWASPVLFIMPRRSRAKAPLE